MQKFTVVKKAKGKGRGVFATRRIKTGQIFEIAPAIVLKSHEEKRMRPLVELSGHFYQWSARRVAIVLGNACFYNHSSEPNAHYWFRYVRPDVVFRALRTIHKGEEITHDYTAGSDREVWFRGAMWGFGELKRKKK